MPIPLLVFLKNLTTAKAFVPNDFLTQYEINRLRLDTYGALKEPVFEEQKLMIVSFYLLAKILIAKILFNPLKLGLLGVNA